MDKYINYDSFLHLTRELIQSAEENIIMNPIFDEENTEEYFFLQSRNREDFVGWILFDDGDNRDFFHTFLYNFLQNKLQFKDLKYDIENFDNFFNALADSYVSAFHVVDSEKKKMTLKDLILGVEVVIDDPQLIMSDDAQCYLLRIARFKDRNYIIQLFNSMSLDFAQVFMRNLWEYFQSDESAFQKESIDTLRPILKSEVMEIFFTYALSLQQYAELTQSLQDSNLFEALMEGFFDEGDERYFRELVQHLEKEQSKNFPGHEEIFHHFLLIYESYLAPRELNFSSVEEIDFEEIYQKLCEVGEFLTREELQTSISLMKRFYEFYFKTSHHPILASLDRVSERMFFYRKLLQNTLYGYYYDEHLTKLVKQFMTVVPTFLYDFEYLVDFAQYDYLYMTKKGDIFPSLARHLAMELNLEATKPDIQNFRLHHFPLLQIFLEFARVKNILYNDGQTLELHPKCFRYLELPSEVKLGIWIETLLKEEFYQPFTSKKNYWKIRTFIAGYLYDLYQERKTSYDPSFLPYLQILNRLGILEDQYDKLTGFGYQIVRYFDQRTVHNKVIDIGKFKREKE